MSSYTPPSARMRTIIAQVGQERAAAAALLETPPAPATPEPPAPVRAMPFPGIPVPAPLVVVDVAPVQDVTVEAVGHIEEELILVDQISILEPAPTPEPEPVVVVVPEPEPVAAPVVDKKKGSKKNKKG